MNIKENGKPTVFIFHLKALMAPILIGSEQCVEITTLVQQIACGGDSAIAFAPGVVKIARSVYSFNAIDTERMLRFDFVWSQSLKGLNEFLDKTWPDGKDVVFVTDDIEFAKVLSLCPISAKLVLVTSLVPNARRSTSVYDELGLNGVILCPKLQSVPYVI